MTSVDVEPCMTSFSNENPIAKDALVAHRHAQGPPSRTTIGAENKQGTTAGASEVPHGLPGFII